uniref:Uncharacterized protein n=1 Tax=candidate division WOR-3 bacterium TaxID=2052148 RepID=A0A7C4XL22_UNCW3
MKIICTALVMTGLLAAGNWAVNGDFEDSLDHGWMKTTGGYNITIDRAPGYDPDPDYELRAEKGGGNGYARVYQIVDIPAINDFSFYVNAKLYAYDNNADTLTYGATAVIVGYLSASGLLLGETRICQFTTPCPWQNTPTCHLIFVDDSLWHSHSFNLNNELGNLPGVNPTDVKKIEIAFYDTTAHTC